MRNKAFDPIRDEDSKLPAFAWPGGYPVLYLDRENETLCPTCANTEDQTPDAEPLTGWFIHYEGPPEFCAECNGQTESAYGDPDSSD